MTSSRARVTYVGAVVGAALLGASFWLGPIVAIAGCAAFVSIVLAAIPGGRTVLASIAVMIAVAAAGSHLMPTLGGVELTSWVFALLAAQGLLARVVANESLTGVEVGSLILLLAGIAAVPFSGDPASSLGGALRMGQHVTVLVALVSLPAARRDVGWVMGGLLVGALVQVCIGFVELVTHRTFFYSLWKPLEAATWHGMMRVASTPADPNYFAIGLVATLALLPAARALWPRVPELLIWAACAVWALMIAFTFSRAGYVGLAVMLGVAGVSGSRRRRWRVMAALLLGSAALTIVLSAVAPAILSRLGSLVAGPDASIVMRLAAQRAALQAFLAHPLLGIGLDQFVRVGPSYLFDVSGLVVGEVNVLNSFLLVACEAGVLGLIGFLLAASWSLFRLRDIGRGRGAELRSDQNPWLTATARWTFVALLVWFGVSLTLDGIHSPIQWVLFGLAGLLVRVVRSPGASGAVFDAS